MMQSNETATGQIVAWRGAAFFAVASVLAAFVFFNSRQLNHDSAWLLDATRRWVAGRRLYADIVEVNPPLIFIENLLLTAGLLTKSAYLAGVCAAIGVSAIWVGRLGGNTALALAAMIVGGCTGFGQRDHLALIFLMPYLSTVRPSYWVGLWAFLGVGLKPYFALIPLAYILAAYFEKRSERLLRLPQNFVIVGGCATLAAATLMIWPHYIFEIIPMAGFVYSAFGIEPAAAHFLIAGLIVILLIISAISERSLLPLAAGTLGAVAVFFIQGRYWSYQFIPSIGLTIYVTGLTLLRAQGPIRIPLAITSIAIAAFQIANMPKGYGPNPVPAGVKSVAFLSDNVSAAYPHVFECGVTHTSRFPAIWTIPGAWNALHDPTSTRKDRDEAAALLKREIGAVQSDLLQGKPQLIYSEDNFASSYFRYPFNYDSLVPAGYRRVGEIRGFRIWARDDLPASLIRGPRCG